MKINKRIQKNKKSIVQFVVFCLIGFPLIFIFPPRKYLFTEDSIVEEDKKYLFKNFVSEIHDNINKQLITTKNLKRRRSKCLLIFRNVEKTCIF